MEVYKYAYECAIRNCQSVLNMLKNLLLTYYVPTTLLVFALDSFCPNILAMPKSDIFGFISSSSKMLLAFKSLCMILNLEYL